MGNISWNTHSQSKLSSEYEIIVHHSSTGFSSKIYTHYNYRVWFESLRVELYNREGKLLDSQPLQYSDHDGYIKLNAQNYTHVMLVISELDKRIYFDIPQLRDNISYYYLNIKYDHDIIELSVIERPYGKTIHKITHRRK